MNNRRGNSLRWIASFVVPLVLYPFVLRALIEAFHPKVGWLVSTVDRLDPSQGVADAFATFAFATYDLLISIWASPLIFFALWLAAGVLGAGAYALRHVRTGGLAARSAST